MSLFDPFTLRGVTPAERPLIFRLSATDWVDGGWELEDTVEFARRLKARGVDMIDCSSGAIGGRQRPQRMPLSQGFQAPFAEAVRRHSGIATMAVGSGTPPRPTRSSRAARPTSWPWPASCSATLTGHCTPPATWAGTRTTGCGSRSSAGD